MGRRRKDSEARQRRGASGAASATALRGDHGWWAGEARFADISAAGGVWRRAGAAGGAGLNRAQGERIRVGLEGGERAERRGGGVAKCRSSGTRARNSCRIEIPLSSPLFHEPPKISYIHPEIVGI